MTHKPAKMNKHPLYLALLGTVIAPSVPASTTHHETEEASFLLGEEAPETPAPLQQEEPELAPVRRRHLFPNDTGRLPNESADEYLRRLYEDNGYVVLGSSSSCTVQTIRCLDCQHFQPNDKLLRIGYGACGLITDRHKQGRWPAALHTCEDFQQTTTIEQRNPRNDDCLSVGPHGGH